MGSSYLHDVWLEDTVRVQHAGHGCGRLRAVRDQCVLQWPTTHYNTVYIIVQCVLQLFTGYSAVQSYKLQYSAVQLFTGYSAVQS